MNVRPVIPATFAGLLGYRLRRNLGAWLILLSVYVGTLWAVHLGLLPLIVGRLA